VLLQKTVEIDPEETLGGLYFNKLFPLGVQAMVESVDLVRAGKAPKMVQNESKATYEGWCKADDVIVNWSSNAKIIFDMIRGSDPQPGANTVFDGTRLTLYDTSMRSTEYSDSVPGQVIHVNETGIEIAAVGGSIVIGRVRADRGKKIGAVEWAESVGLVVGDLFRN
jgi:methionyl-tRNA formyltransferase